MSTFTHEFVWPSSSPETVIVTGSFDNWSKSTYLTREEDRFARTIELKHAQAVDGKIHFKYIVDGEWRVDSSQPQDKDEKNNENNYLVVPELIENEKMDNEEKLVPLPISPLAPETISTEVVPEPVNGKTPSPQLPPLPIVPLAPEMISTDAPTDNANDKASESQLPPLPVLPLAPETILPASTEKEASESDLKPLGVAPIAPEGTVPPVAEKAGVTHDDIKAAVEAEERGENVDSVKERLEKVSADNNNQPQPELKPLGVVPIAPEGAVPPIAEKAGLSHEEIQAAVEAEQRGESVEEVLSKLESDKKGIENGDPSNTNEQSGLNASKDNKSRAPVESTEATSASLPPAEMPFPADLTKTAEPSTAPIKVPEKRAEAPSAPEGTKSAETAATSAVTSPPQNATSENPNPEPGQQQKSPSKLKDFFRKLITCSF
ncbi:uncharacterized protein VTP21DRAFT_9488 [Calcarisporiella thermophila]|uniref:uncharacterized protein n=1 Tax=Calcarisporiella thermophila TaxID=911321 RepID=UPI00374441C7